MALINIFKNWQKAKDYDSIVKENKILSKRLEELRQDILSLEDYSCGYLSDRPIDLHPMLDSLADNIRKLKSMNIDYQCNIINLKMKLQKRDTKTGRFVKK